MTVLLIVFKCKSTLTLALLRGISTTGRGICLFYVVSSASLVNHLASLNNVIYTSCDFHLRPSSFSDMQSIAFSQTRIGRTLTLGTCMDAGGGGNLSLVGRRNGLFHDIWLWYFRRQIMSLGRALFRKVLLLDKGVFLQIINNDRELNSFINQPLHR